MLVLFETPTIFALFKFLNEGKLYEVLNLSLDFPTAGVATKVVKLKVFSKFENIGEVLEVDSCLIDGKASKGLHANFDHEILVVADSKLGNIIKEKLKIDCVHNNVIMELM
ncbi:unnamed protein product [Lathyrus sativus]|nr:unnamed protein product [Lathyrus sativus]